MDTNLPTQQPREKIWHESFEVAVYVKGFLGVLELISGVFLLVIGADNLRHIFTVIMSKNLPWNLDVFVVYFSHQYISHLRVATKNFAGIYVISRAVINLFLIVGLIKQKGWAYLTAIGVMASFTLYQILRLAVHPRWFLGTLTFFDIIFILLVWHEYKRLTLSQKTDTNIKDLI